MEGDARGGCRTLPIVYGVRRAAWLISPSFVVPFVMISAGAFAGVLTGNFVLLQLLSIVMTVYGAVRLLPDAAPPRGSRRRREPRVLGAHVSDDVRRAGRVRARLSASERQPRSPAPAPRSDELAKLDGARSRSGCKPAIVFLDLRDAPDARIASMDSWQLELTRGHSRRNKGECRNTLLFDLGQRAPTTRTIALRIRDEGASAALDQAQLRADAARYQEVTCRSALNAREGHAVQLDAESLPRLHSRLPLLLRAPLPDAVRARARRRILVGDLREDQPRRRSAAKSSIIRPGSGSRWRSARRRIRISRSKATTS